MGSHVGCFYCEPASSARSVLPMLVASHTVYNIEYHFVWVTKYRYKVLIGDVALCVRELVRQTYEIFEITPLGLDPASHLIRPTSVLLPQDVSWVEGAKQQFVPGLSS